MSGRSSAAVTFSNNEQKTKRAIAKDLRNTGVFLLAAVGLQATQLLGRLGGPFLDSSYEEEPRLVATPGYPITPRVQIGE